MNKNGKIYNKLRKLYYRLTGKQEKIKSETNYLPLDKEKTFEKICSYDVISFDIFDTLLARTIYNPDDLFYIMQEILQDKDFFVKRKEAEKKANEVYQKDVSLIEIYDMYKKLYQEDSKKIRELEIELELNLCIPRTDMLDIFNRLKDLGKTIILTSDMYLDKSVIEKMLEKCGYHHYDKLYLSNDLNKRKDRKDIWPFLLQIYGEKRIIHIGDNEKSDYIYPKEFGIDSIKIESGRQLFEKTELFSHIQEFLGNNNSNSILLGTIINKKLFNSPFSDLKINTLDDFGYIFHAPILEQYLSFVVNNTKDQDQLLFLAREGFYLQKLYKEYCQLFSKKEINNLYFLTSRKATSTANISSENDIELLLDNEFDGRLKSFYSQILEVNYRGKDKPLKLPQEKEKVLEHLDEYQNEILKRTTQEKKNYLFYIKNELGNYKEKKISLIDLGYSGTIQYQLTKLTKKEMTGIYLTNSEHVKRYGKKSALKFLFDINENEEYKKIYHYSLILEYFLSAPYGQLIKFEKNNKEIIPIYNQEVLDEQKKKSLQIIYQNVLEYFSDIQKVNAYIPFKPDLGLLCRIYTCIIEEDLVAKKVKDQFEFVDAFCSSEPKNVFKIISRY